MLWDYELSVHILLALAFTCTYFFWRYLSRTRLSVISLWSCQESLSRPICFHTIKLISYKIDLVPHYHYHGHISSNVWYTGTHTSVINSKNQRVRPKRNILKHRPPFSSLLCNQSSVVLIMLYFVFIMNNDFTSYGRVSHMCEYTDTLFSL